MTNPNKVTPFRQRRLTGRKLGAKQLEDWHKECERRRKNIELGKRGRWVAPEHNKVGCSWKGDKIMTTGFVRHTKGKHGEKIEHRYYGTIPIFGNCYDKQFNGVV